MNAKPTRSKKISEHHERFFSAATHRDSNGAIKMQLFREAKILEALNHSSIIQLKEFYRISNNKLVLILEYAENGDLKQSIEKMIFNNNFFSESQILSKFIK